MRDNSRLTRPRVVGRQARRRTTLAIVVTTAMAATLAVAAFPGSAAAKGGLPTWPANPDWQSLVPAPSSDDVKPVSVVRTAGSVTNPEALLAQGSGSTVLSVSPGGSSASVVLDFGREVGGTPYANVSDSTPTAPATSNNLRVSTSEALTYLNPNTTLARAASAGDSNVKVASVSPFTVGKQMTVDAGANTETATVTAIGTAAATTTSLVAPASAGDTNINVASVGGYTVGSPLMIDTGSGAETTTISTVGTAAGAPTTLAAAASAGDTNVQVRSVAGFAVGQSLLLDTGATFEKRAVSAVGTATAVSSLFSAAAAGDTNVKLTSVAGLSVGATLDVDTGSMQDQVTITSVGTAGANTTVAVANPLSTNLKVASVTGFAAGDTISIDTGASQETATIASVGTAGAAGSGLTLTTPLTIVHPVSAPVLDISKPGTGVSFTPALANAHAALASAVAPGTGITFAPPLTFGHAPGVAVRGSGTGITFSPALTNAHTLGAAVASAGTGVTLSSPLTKPHDPGVPVAGLGSYANDNGAQINLTVTGPSTYTGGLRGGYRLEAIELTTPGTVTLTAAGLNFKAYRATPDKYQGYFISSDDQLNKIWYGGAYTTQMDMVPVGVNSCFSVPVIFDGAKRDRAIWSGDLTVTDPVAQLSLGTNSVPYVKGSIDSIVNLQGSNGRLTSAVGFRGCGAFDYAVTYSAYSAIIAVDYYRYTNDTAYITSLLPKLEAATAYDATVLDANGLAVTNDPDYWQTRQNGEVTEYNLAYYALLQDMSWLEGKVGTPAKATEYTNKAATLKTAINSRLWNAAAGLYQQTDTVPNIFPLDANMNAIRLGVAPADKVASILAYFKSGWQPHGDTISQPSPSLCDPNCHTIEPLNDTWELEARLHSGDTASALDLLRRLWGVQVDPNSGFYTGTFWEFVGSNGLPTRGFDSLAHGWAAGPTQLLTESVLGATPVDPGYSTWRVKPQPSDLGWAEGQVPTANGSLAVKWAQDTGSGKFHMQVVSPSATGGEVWVPLASASKSISLPLTPGTTFVRRSGNYDVYKVGAGTFEFSSTPVTFTSLEQLVAYFSTDPTVTSGLNDKLAAAAAAKSTGIRNKQLDAFVAQVNAQTGKALTPEEAQVLITLAAALR
jgi:hypothetical protein